MFGHANALTLAAPVTLQLKTIPRGSLAQHIRNLPMPRVAGVVRGWLVMGIASVQSQYGCAWANFPIQCWRRMSRALAHRFYLCLAGFIVVLWPLHASVY